MEENEEKPKVEEHHEEHNEEHHEEKHLEEPEKKVDKFKVNKRVILWIIIAILAIAVIYVVFFRDATTGQAIASTTQQAARSSSGMVGGC